MRILQELFQQAVLRDVILMDLQENVLLQTEAKVRADVSRSLCDAQCTIGQTIDGPAVTGIVGLNDEILDDEISISFEHSTGWQIFWFEDDVLINAKVFDFLSFCRPWSFFGRLFPWFASRLEQSTGLDIRPLGGAFKPLNFVLQLLLFFL